MKTETIEQPKREKLSPREYILFLARSFPCLADKFIGMEPENWDIQDIVLGSARWSTGEKLCLMFVASVWNPFFARVNHWHFNLFDFVSTVDAANRAVVERWMKTPYFP